MNPRNGKRDPKMGEVYLINFNGTDSEQRGFRPGVIFQNNIGNKFSPNVIVLPFTSAIKKTSQPTHVRIPKEVGIRVDSMVLCENPERMSKEKLGDYITTLPEKYMGQIAAASLLATSAISYIDLDVLVSVWKRAILLNYSKSESRKEASYV